PRRHPEPVQPSALLQSEPQSDEHELRTGAVCHQRRHALHHVRDAVDVLVWREAPQGSIPWGAQSATMHGPGTNPWSVSLVDDSSLHLEVDVRRVLLATGLLAGLSVGASVLAQAPQQQQDEI